MVSKKKSTPSVVEREVIYPELSVELCIGEDGISASLAKDLLGWEEESDTVKFGADYLFTDRRGRKIRCLNNVTNRPLYLGNVEGLVQEQLMKRWVFNGEPILIGKTGLVLNGQHQLVGVVFAEQERTSDEGKFHWETYWDGPVKIDKVIVKGLEETDRVVNTMDTCKPRSLADVIYRSEYFKNMKPSDRKLASRMADYAIRLLWHRTGAGMDAFAPRRTHSEALDFINRHPKLLKAVKHIMEEDTEQKISRHMPGRSAGTAAGLLYLFAASKSDGDAYRNAEPPSEKKLDLEYWDRACEFFVALAEGSKDIVAVWQAMAGLVEEPSTGLGGTRDEKFAVLVKAWNLFKDGTKVTLDDLTVEYALDEEQQKHLDDFPMCGGIDLGNPKEADKESKRQEDKEEDAGDPTGEPDEDETEEEKAKRVRKEQVEATKKRIEEAKQRVKEKAKEEERAEAEAAKGETPATTPPAKPKRVTRKDVEAAQTEKAKKADEEQQPEPAEETPTEPKPAPKKPTPKKVGPAK